HLQRKATRIARQLRDFRFGIPARREIELIRFVYELSGTGTAGIVKRLEGDLHFQRSEVRLDISPLLAESHSARVAFIEFSALGILIREDDGFEVTRRAQRPGI